MPDVLQGVTLPWRDASAVALSAPTTTPWKDAVAILSRGNAFTPGAPPGGSTQTSSGVPVSTFRIAPASSYLAAPAFTLKDARDDTLLGVTDVTIGTDADSVFWSLRASAPGTSVFDKLRAGDLPATVVFETDDQTWSFVIDSVSRDRRHGQWVTSIAGRSTSVLAGAPYEAEQNWANDAIIGADTLASLANLYTGVAVDWYVETWLLPERAFNVTGTPLQVVKALAEAIGGIVASHPSEARLSVLPRYPTLPNEWASAGADLDLALDAVTSEQIESAESTEYDAVFLSGQQSGVLGFVMVQGTNASKTHPFVSDPLLTDEPALRQRGEAILGASTGGLERVTQTLPVLPGVGVFLLNWLVRVQDPAKVWHGLVRSVSATFRHGQASQTVGFERHRHVWQGTTAVGGPPAALPPAPVNYFILRNKLAVTPPGNLRSYNAWPVALRLLNGDILVGYTRTLAHHTSTTGEAVLKRSSDNGATWGSEVLVYDDPSLFATIYGLGQSSTGRVFATMWKDNPSSGDIGQALISYSDDDGATWSAPVDVTATCGFTRSGFGAGPVVQALNGHLLVTIEGHDTGEALLTDERCVLLRSRDDGATWGEAFTVTDGARTYFESKLLRLGSGELLLLHRTGQTSGDVYIQRSTDHGFTWTTPALAFPMIAGPSSVQLINGSIVVAGRKDINGRAVLRVSNDEGATWVESYVDDPGYDSPYAAPIDLLDGRVLVLYGSEKVNGSTCDILAALATPIETLGPAWSVVGSNIAVEYNDYFAACASGGGSARAAVGRGSTGHWYFEVTAAEGDANVLIGVTTAADTLASYPGIVSGSYAVYLLDGNKYIANAGSAFTSAIPAGSCVGIELDAGTLKVWVNGVLAGTLASGVTGPVYPAWGPGTTGALRRGALLNLGSVPFVSLPAGATAWGAAV